MIPFFKEYGTGRPLIILHCLLGSLDNLHTLSTSFAKHRRVIAVDQRNHGRSAHSDEMTYPALASDLLDLYDHLLLPPASLLGHSMGGKTAMRFALDNPDRVEKLIVVDIAPRAYPSLHDGIFDALRSIDLSTVQARQQVDAQLARHVPDAAIRQFLMKNLGSDDAGRFTWKANIKVLEMKYGELMKGIDSGTPFQKPTLFVRGSRSGYIDRSDNINILHLFPEAQIVTIEAGHWVHAEAPGRFFEVVRDFLDPAT